jgi:predicted phage-related endonuclease
MNITRNNVRKLKQLINQQKELEKQIEQLKKAIKEDMEQQQIESKAWADIAVQLVNVSRDIVDSKTLKADYPDIYGKLAHTTTYARLDIK